MYHPVTLQAMATARRQDLMREADARRLARQARQGQPRILEGLGGLLAETRERLKEDRAPQGNNSLGWAEE
jgi:hypothetical protein